MNALNTSNRRVIMLGTTVGDRGGIGSVVAILRDSGLFARNQVEYIATHRDGTIAQKIYIAALAWCKCMMRLITARALCLHVHLASRGSFWRKQLFVFPAFLLRVPVILHLHGGEFHIFYGQECGPFAKWCIRTVFQRSSAVIVLSDSWANWIRNTFSGVNVAVISNPVIVPPESTLARDPAAVLFLGRLCKGKGTFVLLDAAALLCRAGVEIKLWLGGDGEIEVFRQRADDLGISDSVQFLGWVSGEQKSDLLRTAGIYCLPSFNEGLPISLLEAMAIGMPVVTTPVGGIPEVVSDQIDGLLVAPGNAEVLAEKLCDLIRNPSIAGHMGREGRKKILGSFSVDVIVPKIEALYGSLK